MHSGRFVAERSDGWLQLLREVLEAVPSAGLGEVRITKWLMKASLPRL